MKYFWYCLFLIIGLLMNREADAQLILPCEDPLKYNQYFSCGEPFMPVCGCNQKTYRNGCVSLNVFGVNEIFSDGVCKDENFYFEINPNASYEKTTFNIQFYTTGSYSIQIFDLYGKVMYFNNQSNVHWIQDDIYFSGFRPGFYLFTVTSGNTFRTKKLIVK